MYSFHTKINQNGRVIIPSILKKELGLKNGDEVIVSKSDDGSIKISSIMQSIKKVQELVISAGVKNLTEQLSQLRKNEDL